MLRFRRPDRRFQQVRDSSCVSRGRSCARYARFVLVNCEVSLPTLPRLKCWSSTKVCMSDILLFSKANMHDFVATSAVDLDTDRAIQEIIRGPIFRDVTILTIAYVMCTIDSQC